MKMFALQSYGILRNVSKSYIKKSVNYYSEYIKPLTLHPNCHIKPHQNMKKYLLPVVTLLLAVPAFALDVVNLRTEDYRNPIGIDRSTIHFSWQLESEQRGVVQTSYSLQIATDAAFGNVVWESAGVNSDESVFVEAKGFVPAAETRYYWRVTVADNKGETATSTEKAYFETGLMRADAWSSTQWIKASTSPSEGGENEAPADYEVEVKFTVKQLAAGLIFAASDHSNYYMWQVNTNGSLRFRPHRWSGGNPALLSEAAITGVSVKNGEQHTLKVSVTGSNVARTYIDNILIDTRTGDFAYGDFGFREDYDNGNQPEQALFDDFKVTAAGKTLLEENFDGSSCMFQSGTLQSGQFYVSGPATYAWQQKAAKPVRFDVDFDFTLVNDNASICFSATSGSTYMMWAINTLDVSQPVVRRHVYLNGNLTYNDTPITAFSKADIIGKQHHITLECETPYVRTYIDDVLVDTYQDTQGVLAIGDLGMRVSATGNERERAYFDNITQTVYDEDGNPTVTFSEDFEGAGNAFNATDIRDFGGSRQCYMEAAVGGAKRLMQQDGSIAAGMPMFRKTFELGGAIRRARLYATGLGVYNVFINGERVGQTDDDGNTLYDELKPGATEMKKTVFYTTHDVTALLQQGMNAIGAEVSTGWWNGGIVHGMYGNKPNAFRALLKVEMEDGTVVTIPTDLSWRSNTNGPLRKGDIYNGETYDARLEAGQFTPDFDDSDWFGVAVSNDFKGEIRAFEGPAIMAVEGLRRYPKTIQIYEGTKANGKTFGEIDVLSELKEQNNFTLKAGQTAVIDLGQNASGWVSFTAKGEPGTKLRFRFGEMPNTTGDRGRGDDGPAGSIYTENLRSAEATLYYTLKGAAEGESFHPTTTYFGFRYIEVTTSADVELTNVIGETVTSAVEEKSSFCTSHADVNQLYSNVMWGQRSNFVSVPTDCPQRDERMGWTADTQVYSLTGLYNGDTRNFYKKWMRDMRDAQRSDGAYPVIAPYHWGVEYASTGWSEAGIIVPWNVYMMTGDKDILRDNFEANERYMQFLTTKAGGGYQYNGSDPIHGDWVAYVSTDGRYISVSYYAYVADLMARTCRALSEQEGDTYSQKAEQYEQLFQNIKAEWQTRFLSKSKVPTQATQCGYLMALRYNLLPDEQSVSRTCTYLHRAIQNNAFKLNTGFLGTAILNQTLTENGLIDDAYTLLLQRNDPSWLYSIDQGATTIWERWNSYTVASGYGPVSMNSFNHYAYGVVAEWMFHHMAGIAPDEQQPGFKHILLQPYPDTRSVLRFGSARITSVDADFASDYGSIKADWQCDGSKEMTYSVTIPANTSATLRLPIADGLYVYESGQEAELAEGVTYMGTADGYAIYEVGSGSYLFSVSSEIPDGLKGLRDLKDSKDLRDPKDTVYSIDGKILPTDSVHGIVITGGKKIAVK